MDEIIQEALSKGVEMHVAGEFEFAGQLYGSVIKLQPNHADANHNMGLLKIDTGNDLEALPYLQTALEADTNITQFWRSYIKVLINLGRVDEASRILNLAKENGVEGEEFGELDQKLNEPVTIDRIRAISKNIFSKSTKLQVSIPV
jgi:tetratricopeptide (TPR) repeat protein